jgi:hypothetical protein
MARRLALDQTPDQTLDQTPDQIEFAATAAASVPEPAKVERQEPVSESPLIARIHPEPASMTGDGQLRLHVHLIGGPEHGRCIGVIVPAQPDIITNGCRYAIGYDHLIARHVARFAERL